MALSALLESVPQTQFFGDAEARIFGAFLLARGCRGLAAEMVNLRAFVQGSVYLGSARKRQPGHPLVVAYEVINGLPWREALPLLAAVAAGQPARGCRVAAALRKLAAGTLAIQSLLAEEAAK